jgi:hypothetical protein
MAAAQQRQQFPIDHLRGAHAAADVGDQGFLELLRLDRRPFSDELRIEALRFDSIRWFGLLAWPPSIRGLLRHRDPAFVRARVRGRSGVVSGDVDRRVFQPRRSSS